MPIHPVVLEQDPSIMPSQSELFAQLAQLKAALLAERGQLQAALKQVQALTTERDQLKASHERLRDELELLKRRIFVAKAERVDSKQLELEFFHKLSELNELEKELATELNPEPAQGANDEQNPPPKNRPKPKGRRNLSLMSLPKECIELKEETMEGLVSQGLAERMGIEESSRLGYRRGGYICIVTLRSKYKMVDEKAKDKATIVTTPMPKELFPRSMAAPSMLAHIATEKYCDGLPLYRLEERLARHGLELDRGTMCRWLEDAGATLGATIVEAARKEALKKAFCIATDATGVLIQPLQSPKKERQPCKRGHFFVQIADKDHVFFEYVPRETSAAVAKMFHGFSGYVQADAKSVYDVLFVEPDERKRRLNAGKRGNEPPDEPDEETRQELACWAHARRKYWEAATAKNTIAREGLYRIQRLFELEARWKGKAPAEIKRMREAFSRPHLDAFFGWVSEEYERVKGCRGLLESAFGYTIRHKGALMRYVEDGRLLMDNNRSERALRHVAVGRKAWLFMGSDDHAQSAAHFFSLIMSAKMHGLEPEGYLRDMFRVLAHWPRERYIELAPKYWAETRLRLDGRELEAEVGALMVPASLDGVG